jgi:hypothetical protein
VSKALSGKRDIGGDSESAAEFKNRLWVLVDYIFNFAGQAAVGGA